MLLTDQKMLLAILDRETAFRLDIECRAVRFGQTEVRCVFRCSFRPDVCDLMLVADDQTGIFNLARNGITKPDR